MKGELCRTLTADGLELHGFLAIPEGDRPDTFVIHVHGLAGNFYENRFIEDVGEAVIDSGRGFLTVNTRGRDYLSDFILEKPDGTKEYRQIGGIHEIFEECVEDIEAWIAFLRTHGARHFILQGHSHGALKVTYYLYSKPDSCVDSLILLSPSDDFGCQRVRLGDRFNQATAVARKMIAEGRGADMMPEGYFHYPVSAATYLDIFGRRSRLSLFNLSRTDRREFPELRSIRIPVLTIVGSVEEAFVEPPEEYLSLVRNELENAPAFLGAVIHGAPHNYLDFEGQVAGHIAKWLASGTAG